MNDDRDFDRYARQVRFAPFGEEGQRRLSAARALVCGCGALGSVISNTLVRAGVGTVRVVDRDFLELNNLQRQVLYDEADVAAGLPKAIAAANKLRSINSQVTVEPVVSDVTHHNVAALADGMDVIVDGTDNFETRMLLNDYAVKHGRPWVYGGCIGAEGQMMAVLPGETACLACLMPELPPPGSTPTCDTAGILGPAVNVVASLEAMEAIKLLAGRREAVCRKLTILDLWENRLRQMDLSRLRESGECRVCSRGEFRWLSGELGGAPTILCGRNAVQVSGLVDGNLSLERLAQRLAGVGEVTQNAFLVRLAVDAYVLTVFADGRTIVAGTDDIATARTLVAKYVGS